MTKTEFAQFYNQNIKEVYRFIFLKVNSQETAQDLTSEAFLKLLNYIRENSNTDIKNSRAFLYKIARNLVIDFYRQKYKQPLPLDDSLELQSGHRQQPDFQADLAIGLRQIKSALGQIKDDYADVIVWHYLNDMSVQEIAGIINKPEGTVRVMLHRGLRDIKEQLEGRFLTASPRGDF